MHGVDEVWPLAQQRRTFAQAFAHQPDLPVFQVTKSTMDDASGTACGAGSEIVLFDEKSSSSGSSALPRDRHAVNATTDHHDLVVRAVEWRSCCGGCHHRETREARI